MDFAKSIYLGGKEISASDPILSKKSIKELGLLCTDCGEPVHLRNGEIRQPYFAHYSRISSLKYNECSLRQKAEISAVGQADLTNRQNDESQRLRDFQKYFLGILKLKELDYQDNKLNEKQNEIMEIAQKDSQIFYKHIDSLKKLDSLERDIIREAFEFIIAPSSTMIFKVVVHRAVERLSKSPKKPRKRSKKNAEILKVVPRERKVERIISRKNRKPEFKYEKRRKRHPLVLNQQKQYPDSDSVCHEIIKLLQEIKWVAIFNQIIN